MERPILFSGEMVKAILARRKTMTRRVINPDRYMQCLSPVDEPEKFVEWCPYGQPGDLLWIRETFAVNTIAGQEVVFYRADSAPDGDGAKWRPSIFMPRKYSRITLRITRVHVEKLRDISEADAIAEGLVSWPSLTQPDVIYYGLSRADIWETNPRLTFKRLWDTINGKRGHGWDTNPVVWVVEFERI